MDYLNGKAKGKMIIRGEKYRFTILSNTLLRLEYNPNGIFYDNPSQFAINRNFEETEYSIRQDERFIEIKTKYYSINYTKEKPFNAGKVVPMSNLRVDLNNTGKSWYVNHQEAKTQKGLIISEDGPNSNQVNQKGLYSLDGFSSFDDSNTLIYDENGNLIKRKDKYMDIYLFMYNNNYQEALNDYYKLTGSPPLIPRYSLGNWWSRELPYTMNDINEIVNDFKKVDIPISILLLKKDWHIININNKEYKTGYTFNKELIEDPAKMIKELHDNSIKIGLSIDPSEGINPHEEHYQQIIDVFKIQQGKKISFDPNNQNTLKVINKYLLKPLYDQGIDFILNDYKDFKNANELWMTNNFLYNGNNSNSRKLILARNGLMASHRYPITYSGDTINDWNSLSKIPEAYINGYNIGNSFISYDISGNYGGIEEEELYIRSIQLGVFSPILRFSAAKGKYYRKEPWRWNIRTTQLVGNYLRLRHSLIPYIYNEYYNYSKYGIPLIKPLSTEVDFIQYDNNYKNQYYFGREMLVCPILTKKDNLINRTISKFYIPDGIWYDFNTGKKFPGNKEYLSFFKEEDYPVFVKSGTIIPLSKDKGNSTNNPTNMEIHIFPGKSNSYTLYEDDGITNEYTNNKYIKTLYEFNYMPNDYTVTITNIEGTIEVIPEYRNYKIRFRNTKYAEQVVVNYNDQIINTVNYKDDNDFIIEINNVPTNGKLTINCKGNNIEIDAMRLINDEIDSILLDLNINTILKEKISAIMFSNLAIKRKRIEIRKLKKFDLSNEYIKLFLKLLEYIEQI